MERQKKKKRKKIEGQDGECERGKTQLEDSFYHLLLMS
jgi:hypothetical protein